MNNYNYQKQLQEVWTKAVDLYSQGFREPDLMFNEREITFITSIGITPQEIYDFAEDFIAAGEPDFATFAMIHDVRRSYFKEEQNESTPESKVDLNSYPAPKESSGGVPYLPRIASKAWSKLTGTLNPDIMYSCGNDRKFLKENDIHPAEFLRKTWETQGNTTKLAEWIGRRKKINSTS